MCNKNSPPPTLTTTPSETQAKYPIMRKTRKQTKDFPTSSTSSTTASLKPLRRRNRTKTRKPKYLSLRLQLSQNRNQNQKQPKKKMTQQQQPKTQQPQLNLFPLHPENMVDDKDMHEENNVALLFSSDGGATLNGLLEDESTTTNTTATATATAATSEEGSFSPPVVDGGDNGSWLVRKAMRRRDDEGSEERWVCYSEVVEKKEFMEEVTSYCSAGGGVGGTTSFGLLSLKLDHEGILNAWSDKGSLYVAGEAPQTVPDLHDDVLLYNALAPNITCDGWGSDAIGNAWNVPENCGANKMKVKEEMGWKLGQREASVQRYKEKRQNRLFAKRIRYEVRKLNAEKRPRMKGRFVKRE